MVFRRRKLLNNTLQIITIKSCTQFCDPITNPDGLCPLPCIPLCLSTCKKPLLLPLDPPPPPPAAHHHLSIFLTVFLSLLAASFLFFTSFAAYKFYKNRGSSVLRRTEQSRFEDEDEGFSDLVDDEQGIMVDHPIWYIRTVGLQPSIINSIAICKYKRGEGLVEGTECSVCLNEFEEDEDLRLLPKCNHAFHIRCIDTWLRSHTNCPMCRARIVESSEPEQSLQSTSGPVQETEIRAESSRGSMGRERESFEERSRNDGDEESGAEIGIRRSVSMDSVSALMVRAIMAEVEASGMIPKYNGRIKGDSCSSSSSSSSYSSSSLIKRSFSCGGKIFSARYNNRRPSTILPR